MKKVLRKLDKKGFTLAELLIVVAIIAVLIAIAIPVFNAQLEKAREAVDAANIRAKYAEMMTDVITGDYAAGTTYEVQLKQKTPDWASTDLKAGLEESMTLAGTMTAGGKATLTYDATQTGKDAVKVTFS